MKINYQSNKSNETTVDKISFYRNIKYREIF